MLTEKELEIIRRKMAQLEREPPAQAWDKIKAAVKPKQRFRMMWWGAALLLPGLLYFLNFSHQQAKKVASNPENRAKSENINKAKTPRLTTPLGNKPAKIKSQNHTLTLPLAPTINQIPDKHTNASNAPLKAVSNKKSKRVNYQLARKIPGAAGQPKPRPERAAADQEKGVLIVATPADTATRPNAPSTLVDAGTLKQSLVNKPDSGAAKPALTAPQKSPPEKRKEKFLGWVFSPTYAFKIVVPHAADSIFITQLKNRNQFNKERFGWELGLQFTQPLTSTLHLEVGLSWLNLKENLTYAFTSDAIDSIRYTQTSPGQVQIKSYPTLETRQIISAYTYGGARVGLAYYFRERPRSKLNVSLTGGANGRLAGKIKQYSNGQLQTLGSAATPDRLPAKFNYSGSVGLGYTRQLGSLFEIRIMPVFHYYFGSPYIKHEPYRLRPYSFGLHFTFKRCFNREKQSTEIPLLSN